ncbi:hypothetical protein DOTSEDRAFT_38743 [Dothistroma septosporum NZE10]|uniref:Uncharacterized protein n=1 Tax=Dothistroma septosporum (strain NZE10 / CBS 128990) TaxID=675120 RepID=M2YL31_DOTSN|nr:hypothetical protein DOTSEDRAFT_38743 [Dothistroma septosporum NZE10]
MASILFSCLPFALLAAASAIPEPRPFAAYHHSCKAHIEALSCAMGKEAYSTASQFCSSYLVHTATTTSTVTTALASTTIQTPFTKDLPATELPQKRAITTTCKTYTPAATFRPIASSACSCLGVKPSTTTKAVTATSTSFNPICRGSEAAIFALQVVTGEFQDLGKVVASNTQATSGSPYIETLQLSHTPSDLTVLYVNGSIPFPDVPQNFASVNSNTYFAADAITAGATSYMSSIGAPKADGGTALLCGGVEEGDDGQYDLQCDPALYDGFGISTADGVTLQLYKGDPTTLNLRPVSLAIFALCPQQH